MSCQHLNPDVASKHAVMSLTRTAALDYAKQGIRINAVNPDPIATKMSDRVVPGHSFKYVAAL